MKYKVEEEKYLEKWNSNKSEVKCHDENRQIVVKVGKRVFLFQ